MCQILPPYKLNYCFAEAGIPGYSSLWERDFGEGQGIKEWRDNTAVSKSLLILCLLFNCFRADRHHVYPAAAEP